MRHLLSIVLAVPAVGALAVLAAGRRRAVVAAAIAIGSAVLTLALALPLWAGFVPRGDQWQFADRVPLVPSIGLGYAVGVDGLGFSLVLLTAVIGVLAAIASWRTASSVTSRESVALLTLECGLLGGFMALDVGLLLACWLVVLASMAVLTGTARLAALSGVLTLAGGLILVASHHAATGVYTFDLATFVTSAIARSAQLWAFAAWTLATATVLVIVVGYLQRPDARVAVSIWLAAVATKMVTYSVARVSLPMLPDAARVAAPTITVVCAIAVVVCTVMVLVTRRWPAFVAYACLAYLAFVVQRLFTLTPDGLTSGLVHQIGHGLAAAAVCLAAAPAASLAWRVLAVPLAALAIGVVLVPSPLAARVETSVARIVLRVSPELAPSVADCLSLPPPKAPEGLPAGAAFVAPCDEAATPSTAPQSPR